MPTVRVLLVQTTQVPLRQSALVQVKVEGPEVKNQPVLMERNLELEEETGLQLEDVLLQPDEDSLAVMVISNPSAIVREVDRDSCLGEGSVIPPVSDIDTDPVSEDVTTEDAVRRINVEDDECRKRKLCDLITLPSVLKPEERTSLLDFLTEHHLAFCLDEYDRGETDLVQLTIDTGDAPPRRQPPQRMPFAVRQEVATQLKKMQQCGVVQPSSSPWASPVVMVRKKDGTHRFCVDYRDLNTITKADTYPLPRIDDLLDQLGKSHYFTTLDLASGYWQIRVHPESQEKTAFVTPQGLFEFHVMPFGLTNAPAVFQRLMQRVLMGLNPPGGKDFVTVYIDDVLVFSQSLQDHLEHLRQVIRCLQEAGLKLKPTKCQFVCREVEYLGHLITPQGLKPNPRLVVAVKEFPVPQNLKQLRQFLGLASYYRRFVADFSKLAQPLHRLTRKDASFEWDSVCQNAFELLKQKLIEAPVLAYPSFDKDFTLETDASALGLGAILSQVQADGRLHPVAYASRALSPQEANYSITELETLAVVWAITYFHTYLYGHSVTVYTDHTAVKAVLETPNPSAKHARWWTRVYGEGVKNVKIVYRSGKTNLPADALSRSPQGAAPDRGPGQDEIQVSSVTSDVTSLLQAEPADSEQQPTNNAYAQEQRQDETLREIILFLEHDQLPVDENRARKIALQSSQFVIVDDVLYFSDTKKDNRRRVVVPKHLRNKILEENHRSHLGAHFSGQKLFSALSRHWRWEGMFADAIHFTRNCPECAVVSGGSKPIKPPLHPIPVQKPFQVIGVDIMELPVTHSGNRYVFVFQDYLTKWPMVYPIPDQKSERIAKIIVNEIIPFFGVPECLLSDRGANLLSHLMLDLCTLLGITKLNTTAYHPQCNGMVERFNRTLKSLLRKHAARFGPQWDEYLSGVLWAYCNVPHESTGEKPSFLLFGVDCRTPTEAALLPSSPLEPTTVETYREQVILNLSTARELAVKTLQKHQQKSKARYDQKAVNRQYRVGDWVLVKFPREESGKNRKLSRPWHGPYRVVDCKEPDLTVTKVYRPQDNQIQIHQERVTPWPSDIASGYYWYGRQNHSPGRPPKWIEGLGDTTVTEEADEGEENDTPLCETDPEDPKVSDAPTERNPSKRYGLRKKVTPPKRLYGVDTRVQRP